MPSAREIAPALIAAGWLGALAYRLAVENEPGGSADWISAVLFWVLTALLLAVGVVALALWARSRLALGRPAHWTDSEAARLALIASLVIGLILRMTTWGGGGQPAVGWAGTVLFFTGLVGLLLRGYRRARRSTSSSAPLWDLPGLRYGLIAVLLGALVFGAVTHPEGTLDSVVNIICIGSFFALVGLLLRSLWRRVRGWGTPA